MSAALPQDEPLQGVDWPEPLPVEPPTRDRGGLRRSTAWALLAVLFALGIALGAWVLSDDVGHPDGRTVVALALAGLALWINDRTERGGSGS